MHQFHGFLRFIAYTDNVWDLCVRDKTHPNNTTTQQSPLTSASAAPPQFTRNPINNYY